MRRLSTFLKFHRNCAGPVQQQGVGAFSFSSVDQFSNHGHTHASANAHAEESSL
jgi:hypothetical protein